MLPDTRARGVAPVEALWAATCARESTCKEPPPDRRQRALGRGAWTIVPPVPTRFQLAAMCESSAWWDPEAVDLSCLIVDDSVEFLDAARSLLEREGIAVLGVAA